MLLHAEAALLALAAICVLSVDGDYTAPKQDSRAAADDRSTLSRIAGINAALPRRHYIPEAKDLCKPEIANQNPFSWGV